MPLYRESRSMGEANMRTVLWAVIKRVTSRVGMSRAGLEHILKQLHVELGGIPPMARHLVGPHQLPTHLTLLGKFHRRLMDHNHKFQA